MHVKTSFLILQDTEEFNPLSTAGLYISSQLPGRRDLKKFIGEGSI
jgi:hypothetical protein